MASKLPSFCTITQPLCKQKEIKYPHITSHSFKDEGKQAKSNKVDSNLRVLRERIEEVKKKERLSTCIRSEIGWNYTTSGYDINHKRHAILSDTVRLAGIVGGALGFVFLSASLSICLVSFLVHFSR